LANQIGVYIIIMIEVLKNSNILDVQTGIICHQTNCVGVMGGGLALQIRNKWPEVYKQYCSFCEGYQNRKAIELLGYVQDVIVDNDLVVANCFG